MGAQADFALSLIPSRELGFRSFAALHEQDQEGISGVKLIAAGSHTSTEMQMAHYNQRLSATTEIVTHKTYQQSSGTTVTKRWDHQCSCNAIGLIGNNARPHFSSCHKNPNFVKPTTSPI